MYGSHKRFPIYNTEFGYITTPPKHDSKKTPWVGQAKAAYYLNWAEYISWRNPRLISFSQYLLYDPLPARPGNDWGGFASGLLSYGKHKPKATYAAWRLPLYMPVTLDPARAQPRGVGLRPARSLTPRPTPARPDPSRSSSSATPAASSRRCARSRSTTRRATSTCT